MNTKSIAEALEKEKNVLIFSVVFLLVYSSPLFILGGNCPYSPWDSLDCMVAWRKILVENQLLFADNYAPVPQIMSGIDRVSLGSEISLFVLLSSVFSAAYSLAVNRFLQIMIGFAGMYLLCKNYLITKHSVLPSAIVAILFAVLPFWSDGILSIAGQPLVFYAYLKIRDDKYKLWHWIVIAMYPFCSTFINWGFFFLIFLFFFFCLHWYRAKQFNLKMLAALIVLFVLGLVTQYREILCMVTDSGYLTHRTERYPHALSFIEVLKGIKALFLYSHGHVISCHYFYIIWFSLLLLLYRFIVHKKTNKRLISFLVSVVAIGFFAGILNWQPVVSFTNKISVFRLVSFERFYALFPLMFFIILAYTFDDIPKFKYSKTLLLLLFAFQFLYTQTKDYTYGGLIKKYVPFIHGRHVNVTFDEFYSEHLFDDIKKSIGKPTDSYRVAALGFHPSVLFYNGFYTIDGYMNNYDVRYKHLFGELIRGELSKNQELKDYFDNWGNRCYLYDDEVGRFIDQKAIATRTASLDIDYSIMHRLNCQYIFSTVEIEHLGAHLALQNVFENNIYKIYLYKII